MTLAHQRRADGLCRRRAKPTASQKTCEEENKGQPDEREPTRRGHFIRWSPWRPSTCPGLVVFWSLCLRRVTRIRTSDERSARSARGREVAAVTSPSHFHWRRYDQRMGEWVRPAGHACESAAPGIHSGAQRWKQADFGFECVLRAKRRVGTTQRGTTLVERTRSLGRTHVSIGSVWPGCSCSFQPGHSSSFPLARGEVDCRRQKRQLEFTAQPGCREDSREPSVKRGGRTDTSGMEGGACLFAVDALLTCPPPFCFPGSAGSQGAIYEFHRGLGGQSIR